MPPPEQPAGRPLSHGLEWAHGLPAQAGYVDDNLIHIQMPADRIIPASQQALALAAMTYAD
eukprot:10417411-Lingulodinium_polyedra.AAC.1